MQTERKHPSHSNRKRGRFFHLYIILAAVIIVAAVAAGSLVFFKAHTFEVVGNSRYTKDELLAAADIAEDTNLVRIPAREIARRMEATMPYLKQVRIRIIPPERVVIEVTETEPSGAIQAGGSVWYIDSGGKLLEQVSSNQGYPAITGLSIVEPAVGTYFQVAEEESLKAKGLRGLLQALEQQQLLTRVDKINVTSSSFITMHYNNRLTVKMGLNDDFSYDLKMLLSAEEGYIAEKWSQGETGTLDMTKRDGEAHLTPDKVGEG